MKGETARVRRPHPPARITPDGITLGTRAVAAALSGCHVNTVRNHAPVVATDVATKAVLVDLDAWVGTYRGQPNER